MTEINRSNFDEPLYKHGLGFSLENLQNKPKLQWENLQTMLSKTCKVKTMVRNKSKKIN